MGGAEPRILYTNRHYETEYETMVADRGAIEYARLSGDESNVAPVKLIVASMSVRYRVRDDRESIRDWYYKCRNSEKVIEAVCSRAKQQYFAGADFDEIMAPGRTRAARELEVLMQARVDAVGLGVDILSVGLEEVHPPVTMKLGPEEEDTRLAEAFRAATLALQKKRVEVLRAERQAIETKAQAQLDSIDRITAARKAYAEKVYETEGQAELFAVRKEVYGDASRVFMMRKYLNEAMRSLRDIRKFVISVDGVNRSHMRIELTEPIGLEITDIEDYDDFGRSQPAESPGGSGLSGDRY
jgi:regulator of protease activity HflC (stomatin/prohibitin superfamily)